MWDHPNKTEALCEHIETMRKTHNKPLKSNFPGVDKFILHRTVIRIQLTHTHTYIQNHTYATHTHTRAVVMKPIRGRLRGWPVLSIDPDTGPLVSKRFIL